MFKRLIFAAPLFILPLAAWALVKPVRVVAPRLEGLTCDEWVCVDDATRRPEATRLYRDALTFVESSVGSLHAVPRAVFCAKPGCSEKFGFTEALAYDVGTFGIVISHRGWRPYLIRHELIHHLQNEPTWFREGMAYSLSQDPRKQLPEPLQGYRSDFEAWFKQVRAARLWAEADHL